MAKHPKSAQPEPETTGRQDKARKGRHALGVQLLSIRTFDVDPASLFPDMTPTSQQAQQPIQTRKT